MNSTQTHTANHTTTHGELQHQHRAQVAHAITTNNTCTLLVVEESHRDKGVGGWATRQKGCEAREQQACTPPHTEKGPTHPPTPHIALS